MTKTDVPLFQIVLAQLIESGRATEGGDLPQEALSTMHNEQLDNGIFVKITRNLLFQQDGEWLFSQWLT